MNPFAKLLLATSNDGKIQEMRAFLSGLPIELLDLRHLALHLHITEDGATYAENAAKKALAYIHASGLPTLADDSGLEVDALNGEPGIRSARYTNIPNATDADRCEYLLSRLKDKPRPWTARFRCVLALALPGQDVRFFEGVCEGEIIPEPRGTGGFGYDPIFLLPALNQTMAELSTPQKNSLSHRGRALQSLLSYLTRLLSE
ncbi:MAG: non-canonical purine NTP pyrophosphatase, RdgB/HAM1 family [Anaerolineae bacterium]|jgi:XTP/dITP diphosphohydrolase|nr:MAG: non-canonical purine NTP pyrophosphatase, RdgB/HAM1 family [Anaerolineae bacterium]